MRLLPCRVSRQTSLTPTRPAWLQTHRIRTLAHMPSGHSGKGHHPLLSSSSDAMDPSNSQITQQGVGVGVGVGGLIHSITEALGLPTSSFAAGGLTLAILGGIAASLRMLSSHLWELAQTQLIVSCEFDSKDESYAWILSYLADHPMTKRTTRFSVSTSLNRQFSSKDATEDILEASRMALPRMFFLPMPGRHYFMFQGRLVWLNRERAKTGGAGGGDMHGERIILSTFGRSRVSLETLVMEARKLYVDKDKARTIIYSADQYGNWRRTRSRPIRPLSTIMMEKNVKESLLSDVIEFFGAEKWYADRGIPYRRGYMFYGYPGTGKTSFVTALAGELKLNIYVISLANKGLTDETLTELMVDTPTRCILLLEDIDAAFVSRTSTTAPSSSNASHSQPTQITLSSAPSQITTNVTFSGLLNAIDGVAAQEGRILVMTTNHLEKLDPALIRPGRVDVKVLFDKATSEMAKQLFIQFFPSSLSLDSDSNKSMNGESKIEDLASKFAKSIPDRLMSMAMIQGYLMKYKRCPERAVQDIDDFVRINSIK